MAEPTGPGSVEREARHLVEAAARWLSAVPDPGTGSSDASDEEGAAGATQPTDARDGAASQDEYVEGPGHAAGSGGGDEHLCRGCPWCRAKAAVGGPVGADTLDSIAHLLGAAAESLSLFAQARREAAAATHEDTTDEGHEEEDEEMLDAVIWIDEEDDEEAAEERRRNR